MPIVVASLGALGGVLSFAFSVWLKSPFHVNVWADPLLSMGLGAGASLVFVFLIANTDRTDRARLISLALLSGFFWQPVWEGARALIERRAEQGKIAAAKQALDHALTLATSLKTQAGNGGATEEALVEATQQVATLTNRLSTVEGLERIQPTAVRLNEALTELPVGNRQLETLRLSGFLASRDSIRPRAANDISAPLATMAAARVAANAAHVPEKLSSSDVPTQQELRKIEIGESVTVSSDGRSKTRWFEIDALSKQTVEISASAASDDLVAALYGRSTLTQIAADDDSGGRMNPRLRVLVEPGSYLLRVSDFSGGVLPEFVVMASVEGQADGAR